MSIGFVYMGGALRMYELFRTFDIAGEQYDTRNFSVVAGFWNYFFEGSHGCPGNGVGT